MTRQQPAIKQEHPSSILFLFSYGLVSRFYVDLLGPAISFCLAASMHTTSLPFFLPFAPFLFSFFLRLFLRRRTNRRISRSNSPICLFSESTNSAVSIHCFFGIRHCTIRRMAPFGSRPASHLVRRLTRCPLAEYKVFVSVQRWTERKGRKARERK